MGRRAGKKISLKRKEIWKLQAALRKAEENKERKVEIKEVKSPQKPQAALPPLLLNKPPPTIRSEARAAAQKKREAQIDVLYLHPDAYYEDPGWSPDEFDAEYFRLWEKEVRREWREKLRRRKIIKLFGMDSDLEEEIRKEEEEERREKEIEIFGGIISSSEDEVEEKDKEAEKMEIEILDEGGKERDMDEMMEVVVVEEGERKEKDEDNDLIIIEEKSRVDKLEEEIDREIERRRAVDAMNKKAGASRRIVPKIIANSWLRTKSQLDLSLPL